MPHRREQTKELLRQLSSPFVQDKPRIGIVLAAGHGQRIRSETSKMLHEIWGKPTVLRVAHAVQAGLESPNQVIVVGIMADDVAHATHAQPGRAFAYQENPALGLPAGTGDAVRVGLDAFPPASERHVYIFLGDMGLLTASAVGHFRCEFERGECDMMVLTGAYSGPTEQNSYGRILRVPSADASGASSGADEGKVIEIKEYKDILNLDGPYEIVYNGRPYTFPRDQLLETREINTGVFAFDESLLRAHIGDIQTDNAQGELMLTDLVDIFNHSGKTVRAVQAESEEEILGFNLKSVWRQMDAIARRWAYELLMDIITIVDDEDFFIDDAVIEQIVAMDKDQGPLDIVIGKGASIGPKVQFNRRVHIGDHCQLSGHIVLGEGVRLESGVHLSAYPEQTLVLEDGVEILTGNILKGNLQVGRDSRIEARVIMTGSDEFPMRVGERVVIKGTSYLYGSIVEDDLLIEHSVIKCKHVEQVRRSDGSTQPIRYVLPQPEGLDSIAEL